MWQILSHWKRWNRVGIVCRFKIIREWGVWSTAEKTKTNFKCYKKMERNILSSSIAKEDRSARPDKGTDLFEASDYHHHDQFMESFSSASYSKLDHDRAWSSREWRTETKTYDLSGRPDKTSWRMVRKVRPGHEEILLDGTAQSARNEETPRDRSGRLDNIKSEEEARPQQFVIGNDEEELELSVETRSFVNRVNDQVRKRQKNFQCYRKWIRTCYDLGNVYGCNNGISDIHGKNFQKQS